MDCTLDWPWLLNMSLQIAKLCNFTKSIRLVGRARGGGSGGGGCWRVRRRARHPAPGCAVLAKRELEARAEPKTGSKAWLRRRLHAAIVREHLDASGL